MASKDRSFGFNVLAVSKGLNEVGREVTKLARTLDDFNRKTAKATVDVDTRKADQKIGRFARDLHQRIDRAVRTLPDIKLGADASQVDRRIADIRRELATLSGKRIGIDVDASQAQARVDQLTSELNRLSRQSPNIQVRADTASAAASLAGISAMASAVGAQDVNIRINAAQMSRAISMLGLITAGLAAVSAAAAPAAAALAALGPAAGAGLQGIATLAAGFSGVGDAVKALGDEEKKAAAGTVVSAATRTNAAQSIAAAQRAVQAATEQAHRAEIQGAQRVQDALQGLRSAEMDHARAVRSAKDAQEDLNRARREAREDIDDLRRSVEGAALSERGANLRLLESQRDLEEARRRAALPEGDPDREVVDDLEWERLKLAVDEADLAVRNAKDRHQDLREESAKAARVGVEGSDRVVDAKRRQLEATERVAESERRLAQAREQVGRAHQQAMWAQADAARAVEEAHIRLGNAQVDAGLQGSTAANKVKEAFEGLTPEAARFARFLHSEVIPGLEGIRDAVQASLLPKMETSLRNLSGLVPVITTGLVGTANVIGDLSERGSAMMASGPWRRDFGTIMASHNRILERFGTAGLSILDAMRSITVAAGPLTERFARFTAQSAMAFDSFVTGARASGELDRWFAEMSDTLAELGHVFGQIVRGLFDLTQAMGPLGMIILRTLGNFIEWVGQVAAANPELTQLAATVLIAFAAFTKIGTAVGALSLVVDVARAGWADLAKVAKGFAPSAVAASATMTRMSGALNAASLSAGVATEKLTRSANAGQAVASAGSRLTGVVTKVGAALPIAGAAAIGLALGYDALTTSSNEATDGLLRGGTAAAEMTQELRENDQYAKQVEDSWFKFIPVIGQVALGISKANTTTAEANAALEEQIAIMPPLEAAQARVTMAQNAYNQAVRDYGPQSAQAAAASHDLALATDTVEQEQKQADAATQSFTDALKRQQQQILNNLDADIAYRDSLVALSESIRNNGTSFDINSEAGRQNLTAMSEVIEASGRLRQSMIDQGASEASATAAAQLHVAQLKNTMVQMGMSEQAAQALIDKYFAVPKDVNTTFRANLGPASRALEQWLGRARAEEVILKVSADTSRIGPLPRAGGGIDVRPMAAGGFRASVVPARTPTLIGDHPRVPESYIPWDRSPRSSRILDITNAAVGRRPRPMAAGGMRAPTVGAMGGGMFDPLAESADDLAKTGLGPLAEEIRKTTVPALETIEDHATKATPDAIRALTAATTTGNAEMSRSWGQLGRDVDSSAQSLRRSMLGWQTASNAAWADIRTRTGAEIGAITGPQFAGLRAGMDSVQAHATRMAGGVGAQYGRLRALTADPIRWSLVHPINRGLVPAWNTVDKFFALQRPMGPVPVGFNTGGTVPGTGNTDKVPALLTPGEEVIPKERAEPHRAFLKALTAGQAEAVQATGGRFARFQMGGTVERVQSLARRHHGQPYVWGGVGPNGADCSGFMSMLVRAARGEANPYRRIGTTGTMPWPGLSPGLNSAFGLGWFTGNPGHMAGTVGGLNVESGGSPSRVKAGPGAAGATHSQFRRHASVPQVGGRFIPGGDSGFDTAAYLKKEFAATRRMIADIRARFGPGNPPTTMTRFGDDAVKGATESASSFDRGGLAQGRGWMWKRQIRPERMLSPKQTALFEELVTALSTHRTGTSGGPAHITAAFQQAAAHIDHTALAAAVDRAMRRWAGSLDGARLRIEDDGKHGMARIVHRQNRALSRR